MTSAQNCSTQRFNHYVLNVLRGKLRSFFSEKTARKMTPTLLTSFKGAVHDHGLDRLGFGGVNSMFGTRQLKGKRICSLSCHKGTLKTEWCNHSCNDSGNQNTHIVPDYIIADIQCFVL